MNWILEAKRVFDVPKPEHFTNYKHCEECAEHDETLINSDIDTIGLDELGKPGWNPICFCSEEGQKYYLPAFIRLSLETMSDDFYFGQFLFHLEYDGENNKLVNSCSQAQRNYIASFLQYAIENYSSEIEQNSYDNEVLRAHEIWSKA